MRVSGVLLLVISTFVACGDDGAAVTPAPDAFVPEVDAGPVSSPLGHIPEEPQPPGDPEAGYRALLNTGFLTCGIPRRVYDTVFGPAPRATRIPGREGPNAGLPYFFTSAIGFTGTEIVSANCLGCHAGRLNGELIIGLGDSSADFTIDAAGAASLARGLAENELERMELLKFIGRMRVAGPYVQTTTIGVTAADNLAAILFAHRDAETLAWLDEPWIEVPRVSVPIDVPPWWRMSKKHAMFYTAAGRGDHSRIMMATSTVCTDTVAEAERLAADFPDVRAYIASLQAPDWPWDIDSSLAARGRIVYQETCARCHGADDEEYPNELVDLDEVATDPLLAEGASYFSPPLVDWFNRSFYGQGARLEIARGYVAPPLDGVWATAPYLHNGSVPTIAALLDSSIRPTYWTRTHDSTDYDQQSLGWNYTELDHGQADEEDPQLRERIYDTTQLGYWNRGHEFGDELTAEERVAVIEYLKTL